MFYKNRLLKPYVFFDVSEGRDVRAVQGTNSGSRRNQVRTGDLSCCLEGLKPCLSGVTGHSAFPAEELESLMAAIM